MCNRLFYLCNSLDSKAILENFYRVNNISVEDFTLFKTACCGIDLIEVHSKVDNGSKSLRHLKILCVSEKDALIFKNSIMPDYFESALLNKLLAVHSDYQFDFLENELS